MCHPTGVDNPATTEKRHVSLMGKPGKGILVNGTERLRFFRFRPIAFSVILGSKSFAMIITLTTDLGEGEPFVAGIKGVLLTRCPEARIVDLAHWVSAFNVLDGALFAAGAFPYFPPDTIHLIAVAPGPEPRALAARIGGQIVVCPDNGILTLLERRFGIDSVCAPGPVCDPPANPLEHVFFGRDILAPVAATIAGGADPSHLGPAAENLRRIDWPSPMRREKNRLDGKIMHIDRFGNLVTNIHLSDIDGTRVERVQSGDFIAYDISRSYYDVPAQHPLAIFGHSGYLEIAYNSDRACDRLDIGPGIFVSVFEKGSSG